MAQVDVDEIEQLHGLPHTEWQDPCLFNDRVHDELRALIAEVRRLRALVPNDPRLERWDATVEYWGDEPPRHWVVFDPESFEWDNIGELKDVRRVSFWPVFE